MLDQRSPQHDLPHSFWGDVCIVSGTICVLLKSCCELLGCCLQISAQFAQALQIETLFLHEIRLAQVRSKACQEFDLMLEHVRLLQMKLFDKRW